MNKKVSVKDIVLIALMTAVLCIISPFSIMIPFSIVPVTLATFGIYLIVYVMGLKKGLISVVLYVLLGFVGLPVFTGFSGGVVKVLGPTGGYIIGYIFLALTEGLFVDFFNEKWIKVLGMIIGTIVLYVFGTLWISYQSKMTFVEALYVAVIPFIIGDIFKMIVAVLLGDNIKNFSNNSKI